VPFGAVCLFGIEPTPTFTSAKILCVRDSLKVGRVAAVAHPTKMVKYEFFGNRAFCIFVGNPVYELTGTTVSDAPVAVLADITFPKPTPF